MNEPLDQFETALLTELRSHVTDRAAKPVSRSHGRAAAIAATVLVAASVGVVASLPGQSTLAFAVTPEPDGDIVVKIHRMDDAEGLERALAAVGVDSVVVYDSRLTPDATGPISFDVPELRSGEPDPNLSPEDCDMLTEMGGDGVTLHLPAVIVRSDAVFHVTLAGTLDRADAQALVISGWVGSPC